MRWKSKPSASRVSNRWSASAVLAANLELDSGFADHMRGRLVD